MILLPSSLFAAAEKTPDPVTGQIFLFGLIFLIFYFLVLRPQNKKARLHKAMLETLDKGNEVITNGGVYGKVYKKPSEGEDFVMVEIAEKTVIKIQKMQVAELATKEVKEPKEPKAKGEA